MLEAIEKMLTLQDRDRKISRLRNELANIGPERHALQAKTAASQAALEASRQRIKQIESDRKKLELEVESKKQAIERYSLQQFQTKKNDEYRALAHEIQTAREAIFKLEDQQLELMEKAETTQKELATATRVSDEAKRMADKQLADLAAAVQQDVLPRYERLRRSKGENVVVGVAHGVCGGCHMKLPVQVIVTCQGHQDIVSCPNCGRILYYTREMSLAVAE